MFGKIGEIKSVKQLGQLRSMSDNEIKESQGEVGKEYVLYMRKEGGTPIKIKLPFKAKKIGCPGLILLVSMISRKPSRSKSIQETYQGFTAG